MIQRIALLIGGFGAVAVLAVALGFGGFVSADQGATDLTAEAAPAAVANGAAQLADGVNSAPQAQAPTKVKIVKDTIYVAPTPGQKVVHVNRPTRNQSTQPAANQANQPQAPAAQPRRDDGEHESDHESERSDQHERSGERGDD